MTPLEAVAAYLGELAEQRRLSPHTIANYRRDLDKLLLAAEGQPLDRLLVHHLRRYISGLHAQGLSGRSLARTLSAWRGFFTWLGERGLVRANPLANLRPPKSSQRLPKSLAVDEAARLLTGASADSGDSRLELRDAAMFELLYSSGLRLSELLQLDRDAVESILAEGEVRVLGKRAKLRLVPVGRMARQAIADWLPVRDSMARGDEPALFLNQHGRRLGARGVQLRLAQRAVRLGLSQHVHPHMLRHAFASHVLQSSGDLRAVQEMLGHASIASTQVYTRLDFQHLAQVYDRAHPRSRRQATISQDSSSDS